MKRSNKLTREEIANAVKRMAAGESAVALAKELNVAVSTVYTWRKKDIAAKSRGSLDERVRGDVPQDTIYKGTVEKLVRENRLLRKIVGDMMVSAYLESGDGSGKE